MPDLPGGVLFGWAMLGLAVAATFGWRFLGVVLAGRIDPESPLFDWVSAVAYAMVAGLMMRIVVFPSGAIAATPVADRVLAAAVALAVWYWRGRSLAPGLAAGMAVFGGLLLWRGGAF